MDEFLCSEYNTKNYTEKQFPGLVDTISNILNSMFSMESMELDIFCKSIYPLFRVGPSTEEYILLKSIIFCHAEAPGLSEHAKNILQRYREQYATTLLRRMQARLGTLPGARKYTDILGLLETFFHFTQRKREFHVLIISLLHKYPEMTKFKKSALFERFIIS